MNSAPAGPEWISIRIRETRLGNFYFKRLKKYRIVKLLAPWIWDKIYRTYQYSWILLYAPKMRLQKLSSHKVASHELLLIHSETVETPRPCAFPESKSAFLTSPHADYTFPEIYITEVSNATVTGETNLILADGKVICHDLYDFSLDYTSEELHGRTYVWPAQHTIAWLLPVIPNRRLAYAACFTDACAKNYAHWISEVLPRINIFCSVERWSNVPIIVDEGLHPNLIESLHAVVGTSREIFTISSGMCFHVDQLIVPSVTGYVPFERRSLKSKGFSHGHFSPSALYQLRQKLCNAFELPTIQLPKKIFIKRNSNIRNISNTHDIEACLNLLGFSVIEPEKLTIGQQIAFFANADTIVGATGAAFANLIFCKRTAHVVVLISTCKSLSYWYWQNMASAIGLRITYVLGKSIDRVGTDYHSDYLIEPTDVLQAIHSATPLPDVCSMQEGDFVPMPYRGPSS